MSDGSTHEYDVAVTWTGNRGNGTSSYAGYRRHHQVSAGAAPPILGSSDPSFRGDPDRWNPEQPQVAALAQCHMLWYLHLAATSGVVVTDYRDDAHGVMRQDSDGGGHFEQVTLHPRVTIDGGSDADVALRLHAEVPKLCFIARSVNFPVHHEPTVLREPA